MYISAWTLSMGHMTTDFFLKEVQTVNRDISVITLFCSVWCIIIFLIGRKFLKVPHIITTSYLFTLFISSLGTILWDYCREQGSKSTLLFLFGMMYFGVQCSRLFTASIALGLVAVLSRGQKWLWTRSIWFIILPFMMSFITTVCLMASSEMSSTSDVFAYGKSQDITSFVILFLSLITTIICLIIVFKIPRNNENNNRISSSSSLLPKNNSELSVSEDEDVIQEKERVFCFFKTRCRFGDIQQGRHVVLLLLLSLSMLIGMCLVLWRLLEEEEEGIYFEVAFLDSVFNFGQGFFVFCVFGFDSDLIIDPLVRLWQKLRHGSEDISLPALNTVNRQTLHRCLQFVKYHLDDCKIDIVKEHRSGLTVYSEVFSGTDFCTWLINRGLVNDRSEACLYGKDLLTGRVLYHFHKKHYFHDHNYLYKFEEPKSCFKIMRTASRQNSPAIDRNNTDTSNSAIIPSSSTQIHVTSPSKPYSPRRKQFHGYSFEAFISMSDTENFPESVRHPPAIVRSPLTETSWLSVNNNSNRSDSSEEDIQNGASLQPVKQMKKRKKPTPLKKLNVKSFPRKSDNHSDSSF